MKALARITLVTLLFISFSVTIYAQEAVWKELMDQSDELYQQKRYSEATWVTEKALMIAENTFGPNHPNVRRTLFHLASIYGAQGNHAEAEELYQRAAEIGFDFRAVDQAPSRSGFYLVGFIFIVLPVLGLIIVVCAFGAREWLKGLRQKQRQTMAMSSINDVSEIHREPPDDTPPSVVGSPVLSIFQLIKSSWSLTFDKKKREHRILPFVIVLLFWPVFWFISFFISSLILPDVSLSILFTVIFMLILFVISIGVLYSFHVPQKAGYDQIFVEGFKRFLPSLLVLFLYVIIVIVGLLIFIIPGIYLAIRYSLSCPVVVLENKAGFNALKRSKELTTGCFWALALRYSILICCLVPFYYALFAIFQQPLGVIGLIVKLFAIPISLVFISAYIFNIYASLVAIESTEPAVDEIGVSP